jgi:hypothetical protein
MKHSATPLTNPSAHWPQKAKDARDQCSNWFQTIATETDTAPLDDALKWGQYAWRPTRPRTGSTLRIGCKSSLAVTMAELYPHIENDGSRAMAFDLDQPLPQDALCHLAALTFTYHRKPRS